MNLKETGIRSLFAFFGVAILAFGVAVLRAGEVGIDPFTSANLATAQLLGLTLGVYQLGLNVIILMFVFFLFPLFFSLFFFSWERDSLLCLFFFFSFSFSFFFFFFFSSSWSYILFLFFLTG